MGKQIIARDSLPTDRIFREGLQIHFPRRPLPLPKLIKKVEREAKVKK